MKTLRGFLAVCLGLVFGAHAHAGDAPIWTDVIWPVHPETYAFLGRGIALPSTGTRRDRATRAVCEGQSKCKPHVVPLITALTPPWVCAAPVEGLLYPGGTEPFLIVKWVDDTGESENDAREALARAIAREFSLAKDGTGKVFLRRLHAAQCVRWK